jgi:tetratricopeptide (TPR) repeat protein
MRTGIARVAILALTIVLDGSASTPVNCEQRFVSIDSWVVGPDEVGGKGASESPYSCSDALLSDLAKKTEGESLDENLRVLEPYATLCSGNAEYHALRSHALERGGDLPNAAREMNTAVKIDPLQPNFFFCLAQILFKNGDLGGARFLLERANRDFPQELWTYLFLATVHRDLGSLKEANEVLNLAVTKWPLNAEVHILRGNILSETDQHPRALAEFKKALDIDPKLPQAYLFYGIELDKVDQTEDALHALRECVRLAPGMPNSHYYLGKVLLKKGEAVKAVEQLQAAIDIDPQYALAYLQLGKAYRKLGDRPRAEECLQKYGLLSVQQKSQDAERSKRFRDGLANP